MGVFGKLTQGGYDVPSSESAAVNRILIDELGKHPADVIVLYTAPDDKTVNDPDISRKVTSALDLLPADKVASRVDYWKTSQDALASADKRFALAMITLAGDTFDERQRAFDSIERLIEVDGVPTRIGGRVPTEKALTDRSNTDLTVAEAISLPITLVLLIIIFGSVVAASLPVLVGGLSIFGSLGVLRALSIGLEVNTFAVNVATLLGLGMAIDYGLFIVGRYREEVAAGVERPTAIARTVATAGRTVAFSATLLVIALSGLLLFPMDFLKSMAYGGMAAVAIAATMSLTLLPALLSILGHRVDLLAVPWRRSHGEPRLLGRISDVVMRRPLVFVAPILAMLIALAVPLGGITFGGAGEKQLPPGDPSRVTAEIIAANFPAASNNVATVVLRGRTGQPPSPSEVERFITDAKGVPGVAGVGPANGGTHDDVVLLSVFLTNDANSVGARKTVNALREVPTDVEAFVGGYPALVADTVDSIVDRLPWMLVVLAVATLVLMFLAFGSILLPIKAVLMSALSMSATFGVLVLVFQQGHGAGLLNVTPQPIQAGMLVLIAAVIFGLSTDYETFLLSRMVEARHAGMPTGDAIRTGLVKSGRMITSAALLLGVVTGAFALSALSSMRFIGLGMIIALVLDATVVRMLLVPAVLRLFGDAAWWAPKPLLHLQQKAGLSD